MCIYIGRRRQIYRAASIGIVQSIVAILTVMARVIQAKPMIAIGCVIWIVVAIRTGEIFSRIS